MTVPIVNVPYRIYLGYFITNTFTNKDDKIIKIRFIFYIKFNILLRELMNLFYCLFKNLFCRDFSDFLEAEAVKSSLIPKRT